MDIGILRIPVPRRSAYPVPGIGAIIGLAYALYVYEPSPKVLRYRTVRCMLDAPYQRGSSAVQTSKVALSCGGRLSLTRKGGTLWVLALSSQAVPALSAPIW